MTQFRAAVPRFEFDIVLRGAHVGRVQDLPRRGCIISDQCLCCLHGFMAYSIIFRCSEPFLRCPTSGSLARYRYYTI